MAIPSHRAVWRRPILLPPYGTCSTRRITSLSAAWHTQTALAASRVQIYTSRSHNPYLNLSVEHFLLQTSHPDSTILFLYTNDPCVVIGRNQNPWLEVNLGLLRSSSSSSSPISLVRRRSGGGTVFHDRGNVNYSVICPPAAFDRNKHAEMVVRALHSLGISTARVNERHDIVIADNHPADSSSPSSFKVSGSAYKLTRLRSLHHGTCLLSSPNLADIGRLLRSPAEPYIKARGVESVRSRIRNVGLAAEDFIATVKAEFGKMYGAADLQVVLGEGGSHEDDFAHEQIQKGVKELTSLDWIYNQTPLFTFSTHPSRDDPRDRPPLPPDVPKDFYATITARHGQMQEADIAGVDCDALKGQALHAISDWDRILTSQSVAASAPTVKWFNHLFGVSHPASQ